MPVTRPPPKERVGMVDTGGSSSLPESPPNPSPPSPEPADALNEALDPAPYEPHKSVGVGLSPAGGVEPFPLADSSTEVVVKLLVVLVGICTPFTSDRDVPFILGAVS